MTSPLNNHYHEVQAHECFKSRFTYQCVFVIFISYAGAIPSTLESELRNACKDFDLAMVQNLALIL